MPGKRISELTALSGAGSANNDDVLIFDADAGVAKRISRSQLAEGMQTDVQVFTSKTLALGSNTVTGTTAQFNTALTDNNFATQAGAEALTNKTLALGSNTVTTNDGSRVHEFKDVAALLADTGLVATTSSVVRTRTEGFAYKVAATAAADHHVTTAGGVKLYVLPGANGAAVDAFGAVGDGITDDAAVLTRVATFASAEQTVPIVFDRFYRSTSPLTVASNSLRLVFSVPGKSGILFDNCNGITITQTLRYAGLSIEGGVLATNVNKTRTGLTYTNSASSTGDMLPKAITGLTLIGLDRFRQTGSPYTNGWLTAASITNGDRFSLNEPYIQGSEQDRIDGFPVACKGIVASGSTHLIVNDPAVFCMETAIEVTGQSEGVEVVRGALVANKKGVNFAPDVAPANDTNIVGVHIASAEYNVRLAGSVGTVMHNVSGCLLFTRTEAYVSSTFKHIIVDGQSQISDNYFYTAVAIDPANHIGVDLIAPATGDHNGSLVTANTFLRIPTVVNVGGGVVSAVINGNVTRDDGATVLAAPVVDAGTATTIGFNFGDRDFGEAKSDTGVFWSPVASPGFYTGTTKNLVLSATQAAATVVNFINVVGTDTGSAPIVRALGSDTDIDFTLLPKGAGKIRFGVRTASSDAAVTGYIEIKDAAGTLRRLAVIG